MIKKVIKYVLALTFGIIVGILSKYCDIASGNLSYFGLISSGVLIWLVLGTYILIKSNNRNDFNFFYLLFMLGMMVSYYLYSFFIVEYINRKVILFWVLILLISLVIGNIFYNKRFTKLFRFIYVIASIICIMFDAIVVNGVQLFCVVPEIIVATILFVFICKKKQIFASY